MSISFSRFVPIPVYVATDATYIPPQKNTQIGLMVVQFHGISRAGVHLTRYGTFRLVFKEINSKESQKNVRELKEFLQAIEAEDLPDYLPPERQKEFTEFLHAHINVHRPLIVYRSNYRTNTNSYERYTGDDQVIVPAEYTGFDDRTKEVIHKLLMIGRRTKK